MSRVMDYLLNEGIDCVKISGLKKGSVSKPLFFPLKISDDEDLKETLKRVEGITNEGLEIQVDYMIGDDIKKLNPKLGRINDNECYSVLKIGYPPR